MNKYIFVSLVFLLELDVSSMDRFWGQIRNYAINPSELLNNLRDIEEDRRAICFRDCFEEGKSPEDEFNKIDDLELKKEIRKAAQYVSEALYEKASKADWKESLPDLIKAKRFASIILVDSSFFQNKYEEDDASYISTRISNMVLNRQRFFDAFEVLEFD
ncbi:MAG: hypothetical protein LBJ71_01035 [Holosporaceae bacterium]|nr:hypothetical protein [Holosporaceae bacterium]